MKKIPALRNLNNKEVVTIKMPKYLGDKNGEKQYDMSTLVETQISLPTGWKDMLARGEDVPFDFINNVQEIDGINCFVAWLDQVTEGK